MRARSLWLRLSAAAAALVALALALGGVGLFLIFDWALDRRTADELNETAKFLAGQAAFDAAGRLSLEQTPADPRFEAPYGGLYWQVEAETGARLASRSLWDRTLALPPTPAGMAHHAIVDLAGPDGGRLIAVIRQVAIKTPPGAPPVTIAVAMDRGRLAESRADVLRLLAPSLAALGGALILAMALFVRLALAPFRKLRAELARVHDGAAVRLGGAHPSEVQPLADDLNRLLDANDRAIERARSQAGDMAHGLKTPLAVLGALARRLAPSEPKLAAEIEEQAGAMQAQASRSLARARSAVSAALKKQRTPVAPVVAEIADALRRLPSEGPVDWRLDAPAEAGCPASEGDLLEMLGALMDNARKWARGRILVSAASSDGEDRIVVEDDGPGMDDDQTAAIARGRRWDEATPGTGFGLAITRDLVEASGGRLELGRSALGGLRAALVWGR